MKTRCIFLLLISLALLASCTIEKRHYRNGFYWNWNRNEQQRAVIEERDTLSTSGSGDEISAEESTTASEERVTIDSAGENHIEFHAGVFSDSGGQDMSYDIGRTSENVVILSGVEGDDPKPEGHDRLNPKIAPMMIGGVVLSLLFLLVDLFGIAGSAPFFFVIAPLIGVLLFVGAMLLRNAYVTRAASGEKNDGLRLSAHFHRFRIMLLLFFAGALAMTIGWGFALGGGSSLAASGLIAVILGGSGMVIVQGVGIILLILALLYLFRWRKDSTGYKPKRDPHPPKDR